MKAKSRYVSPTYKVYELYADDVITASGENQPQDNWFEERAEGWGEWKPAPIQGN